MPISAANMFNLGDVLDLIVEKFPRGTESDEEDVTKIAVIGKPNVGKSSLINALLGEERVIVSDIAGTTRDSVDTPFTRGDEKLHPHRHCRDPEERARSPEISSDTASSGLSPPSSAATWRC